MFRSWIPAALGVLLAPAVAAGPAAAQSLGTIKWQLQPYCNVVTVTVTTQGGVYALDGTDDQCGAGRLAAADGTAFLNPDGSVGLGFTIVPSPTGAPVTVEASISVATLTGTWRDSAGNTGTMQPAPNGGTGGAPRPQGTAIAGVQVGRGLSYAASAQGDAVLAIDDERVRETVAVREENSNIGLGRNVMPRVTDAAGSVAVGSSALNALRTGWYNTAVGANALQKTEEGADNVGIGAYALSENISGKDNVAVGVSALSRVIVSDANVGVGDGALPQLQLGRNNVGIGQLAGFGLVAGSYNIYINAAGQSLDDHTTRIGTGQTRTFISGIRGVATGAGNAVPVVIDSNGQLGTVNSSRRFKEDIEDLGAAADAVLRLRPVQFRYTAPHADGSQPLQYGLIAEEVAEVLPELVSRNAGGEIETVQYQTLPTLLLAQVRRLERERADLASRLAALEAEMAAIRASMPRLQP